MQYVLLYLFIFSCFCFTVIKALSEYNKVSQDYCSVYTVLSFSA